MRLGAPVFGDCFTPAVWIAALKRCGYSAAYCPLDGSADEATIRAYAQVAAARKIWEEMGYRGG